MTILDEPAFDAFWHERHYSTLTTFRRNGTPHVVPVSVTWDPAARVARVVASSTSRKVRNIEAANARAEGAPADGARVALCQVQGRRWATLEGRATVRTDAALIADAERRYAERYGHAPRPNPARVLIEIAVDHAMGRLR